MTSQDKEDKTDTPSVNHISPELIAQIKQQVINEMREEENFKKEEDRLRQEAQKKQHEEYVAKMKASPDPWVDIVGWAENGKGIKVELEWNDAFVTELRQQGISGADEDQTVQKWLTLLMHDLANEKGKEGDFE